MSYISHVSEQEANAATVPVRTAILKMRFFISLALLSVIVLYALRDGHRVGRVVGSREIASRYRDVQLQSFHVEEILAVGEKLLPAFVDDVVFGDFARFALGERRQVARLHQ